MTLGSRPFPAPFGAYPGASIHSKLARDSGNSRPDAPRNEPTEYGELDSTSNIDRHNGRGLNPAKSQFFSGITLATSNQPYWSDFNSPVS